MALSARWRRASRCESGNCVEVRKVDDMILSEQWRKATKSNNNGACAEVRRRGGIVQIRDSKDFEGPFLSFTEQEWDAFLDGAKNGEFEIV